MRTFKFLGLTFQAGKPENKRNKSRPRSSNLTKAIRDSQLVQGKEDVATWRAAKNQAESVLVPDRTELIRVFKEISLDNHLTSLMNTLENDVVSSPFFIQDQSGENNDELKEIFTRKWFRDFCRFTVQAKHWGYSLVNFGDIVDGAFSETVLVKREFVIPEKRAVKKEMTVPTSGLLYIDDPKWKKWTILIHEPGDLGSLNKAAPHALWKKNASGAWSRAAELFGMPLRVGKTDINDPTQYDNMVQMLTDMGSAFWAVVDNQDEVEFIQANKTDFHQIYDKLIERANSEMSKLITGQTMTSDDGSSLSQAQVHQEIFDKYVQACKTYLADVVNDQLIPLMAFHKMVPFGTRYVQDNEEKMEIGERFNMVDKLLNNYDIDPAWIEETFGVPVEKKEVPEGLQPPGPGPDLEDVESVMPAVSALYDSIHKH